MLHHAYRFASQTAAAIALASAPASAELDVIGLAFAPAIVRPDGEVTPGAALPGWHVNAIWRDAEPAFWASARIDAADAPRWWAGVPRAPLPILHTLDDYRLAIIEYVDSTARQRGYDGAASCAGYVKSTVPAWAAEAATFVAWRDQVWLLTLARLAEVRAGAPPPTIAGLLAEMPAIEWPA